jgi:hypothetical protein
MASMFLCFIPSLDLHLDDINVTVVIADEYESSSSAISNSSSSSASSSGVITQKKRKVGGNAKVLLSDRITRHKKIVFCNKLMITRYINEQLIPFKYLRIFCFEITNIKFFYIFIVVLIIYNTLLNKSVHFNLFSAFKY